MLLLAPPSLTVTVIGAVPYAVVNGGRATEPAKHWMEKETAGLGISAVLLELAVTVRLWISLLAPEVIPERLTVCNPAFSLILRSASELRVGGWLTGLTVTAKERVTILLLAPPSLTVTVM